MIADNSPVPVLLDVSPGELVERAVRNFAPPAVLLALTLSLLWDPSFVPRTAAPMLRTYFVPMALVAAALLCIAFRRGRPLFVILTLMAAYVASFGLAGHRHDDFEWRTLLGSIAVIVPGNMLVYAVLRERGVLNVYGLRRASLVVFECLLVLLVLTDARRVVTDSIYFPLLGDRSAAAPAIPELALSLFGAATVAAAANAVHRNSATDAAFCTALIAFAAGCSVLGAPGTQGVPVKFVLPLGAAAIMIAVGVVLDSSRLAFRDELTGLPGRRALNERMLGLVGRYSIAMVDVDHFKSFNDQWGHDTGDQVLKLVASRLRSPGHGGEAYRFGGEEFAIVFPGKSIGDVFRGLEWIRRDIAGYRFLMRRRRNRAADAPPGSEPPYDARSMICVTISIGVAERGDDLPSPEHVLTAADRALYRAKANGRNRTSR